MSYYTPAFTDADRLVLEQIGDQRTKLRFFLHEPRRWCGSLRRATMARAVQGSNSIEGYHASVEDVVAVIEGEEPLHADESLLKALHFMMMEYDLTKNPGQWRPGAVWVEDQDGQVIDEAPDREGLEALVAELLANVDDDTGEPIVRPAMAHLNLALIHPFREGNGRMAWCVQSWVLAGEGLLSPEFLSIEETEALWDRCEQLVRRHKLPDRTVGPLSDATATRDLGAMAKAGLLRPVGEKRGRSYQPTDELRQAWGSIRQSRPKRATDDPYALAQPELPGRDA